MAYVEDQDKESCTKRECKDCRSPHVPVLHDAERDRGIVTRKDLNNCKDDGQDTEYYEQGNDARVVPCILCSSPLESQ